MSDALLAAPQPIPIAGLAAEQHEAVAQVNALENEAYAAEEEPSDLRWKQAEWVARGLAAGLTTRAFAELWRNPETGKPYSHSHVVFTRKAWAKWGGYLSNQRPRFNTAYNSDEVRKSDRIAKNAAGAHEGTIASDGDAFGTGWKLLLGDFRERLAMLPGASVNLIVTDPPYPAEYLPLWSDLGRESARLLVNGGALIARCGHLFLPEILNRLGEHLQFGWIYAEPLPGSNVRFQGRKIAVAFQPWIAFSNGPWPSGSIDWHPDLLEESPRTKARYVWEQKATVASEITATFARPGHDVLDPFAGSGTYGEAALGVGCRWIGVEQDPAGHAQAAARLSELTS